MVVFCLGCSGEDVDSDRLGGWPVGRRGGPPCCRGVSVCVGVCLHL
jgi:hypothetical protein